LKQPKPNQLPKQVLGYLPLAFAEVLGKTLLFGRVNTAYFGVDVVTEEDG